MNLDFYLRGGAIAFLIVLASFILQKKFRLNLGWLSRSVILVCLVLILKGLEVIWGPAGVPGLVDILLLPYLPIGYANLTYTQFRLAGYGIDEAVNLSYKMSWQIASMIWLNVAALVFFWRSMKSGRKVE